MDAGVVTKREDIPRGMIFATMMVACMISSSMSSRLMARSDLKLKNTCNPVFLLSACSLSIPVFIKTFELGSGGYKKEDQSRLKASCNCVGSCVFEFMVGIFGHR